VGSGSFTAMYNEVVVASGGNFGLSISAAFGPKCMVPSCYADNDCWLACATGGTCKNDGSCSYDESSCKGIFELTLVTGVYPKETS
jgi:hypothetical protein